MALLYITPSEMLGIFQRIPTRAATRAVSQGRTSPGMICGSMSLRQTVLLVAATALLCLAPTPATAQTPDTQEVQLWAQALAIGPISANWRAHLELQPRVFDDVSELGLTIVRTAIGRRVHPRVTLFLGHAWVPRSLGPVTRHEQRIWQQASLVLPTAKGWTNTARIRLEQRWLDPWDDASHRIRLLARAQRPLGTNSPWSIAIYDEAMVTLDNTREGPARGYDRNRAYGGIVRRLSPLLSAELGYIWENSTIRGPSQRNDHIIIGVLNIALNLQR